jgi:hypothetical protein
MQFFEEDCQLGFGGVINRRDPLFDGGAREKDFVLRDDYTGAGRHAQ